MRFILAIAGLSASTAALAAEPVSLASEVFVERVKQEADGTSRTVQEPPKVVTPGDKLVFVLSYRNAGVAPAAGFVVTNPIPAAVRYSGTEAGGAAVSVDGGKSWGDLQALKVRQPDGTDRPAAAADVTHIRWSFSQPIAAGGSGKLSFRGVVK